MNPDNQNGLNPQAEPAATQPTPQQYGTQPTIAQSVAATQPTLTTTPQQPIAETQPTPTGVIPQPVIGTTPLQSTPAVHRSSKKGIIFVAVSVLLAAALAGGWYMMNRPAAKNSNSQNSNHSQNTATDSGSKSDSSNTAASAVGISVGQTKSEVENGPAKGIRPLCSVTDGAEKCSYYGVSGKKVTVTYNASGTVTAVQVK